MTDTVKTPNSNLAVHAGHWVPAVDNRQELDLIKKTYAKDLHDNELQLYVAHANQMGLSIIKKQIYAIVRGSGDKRVVTFQVGIDGYRAITESNPDFRGYEGPEWCGPDGQWVDVWLSPDPPRAARVGIYRSGFQKPIWGVATYDEFVQTYYNQYKKTHVPNSMWEKMPANQLAKCAEAQAHRKATPGVLGGTEMYDEDSPEVEQVEVMGVETTVTVSGGSAAEEWAKANRRLRAIASKHGVTDDQLDLWVKSYRKDSIKDITAQHINGLANSMEAMPGKIESFFEGLAKKYGDADVATDSEDADSGQEDDQVQAEPEDAYEGEYIEVDPETGELIPPYIGESYQSELLDIPTPSRHGTD